MKFLVTILICILFVSTASGQSLTLEDLMKLCVSDTAEISEQLAKIGWQHDLHYTPSQGETMDVWRYNKFGGVKGQDERQLDFWNFNIADKPTFLFYTVNNRSEFDKLRKQVRRKMKKSKEMADSKERSAFKEDADYFDKKFVVMLSPRDDWQYYSITITTTEEYDDYVSGRYIPYFPNPGHNPVN